MKRKIILASCAVVVAFLVLFACTQKASSKSSFIFKSAPKQGVSAKVLGEEITEAELLKGIEADVYDAESKVHEIKMNRLRTLAMEKIMAKDPRKKDLTNEQYLDKFILKGKKSAPSDIDKFIKEKGIPAEQVNDDIRNRVAQYLDMEVKKKAVESWMEEQLAKSPVEVYLVKPMRPVFDVKVNGAMSEGSADAKVTFIEYSDFQCPFCGKAHTEVVKELKKRYKGKIRFVLKHYPLPFHNFAKAASGAALCANEQNKDKAWKLVDLMFENQSKLDNTGLKELADKAGLKSADLLKCVTDNKFASQIDADMAEGTNLGIKSTPTFFINGQMILGAQPLEVFTDLIDEELKK